MALALVFGMGLSLSAGAQQTHLPSMPSRIGFPQYPSISPNGSLIVFSWAGDLWAVAPKGGPATRLTSHAAEERRSAFSPDGHWLAFESDRDGARNLYRVAITHTTGGIATGPIERITEPEHKSDNDELKFLIKFRTLVENDELSKEQLYKKINNLTSRNAEFIKEFFNPEKNQTVAEAWFDMEEEERLS